MDANNIVVIRGRVTNDPTVRTLPSGSIVTQLEVTTRTEALTSSVPVSVIDRQVDVGSGDDVVVTGRVHRRFFRAGGVTQSRTEVVATTVTPVRRKATVRRSIEAVAALLADE